MNCFSDQDTTGVPGTSYPCEFAPPTAFNVDAGGPFGDCAPDGVCDGNDAFHAINAFTDHAACACPLDGGGPAPVSPVVDLGSARIELRTDHSGTLRQGDHISVDLWLLDALPDLRGYQLHMSAARGVFELVDISVDPGHMHVFSGRPFWSAYNLELGQIVVGLDRPGIGTETNAYLATFTYRVADDPAGTFRVELLADHNQLSHRTFLQATPARGRIRIAGDPVLTFGTPRKRGSRHPTRRHEP